MRPTLAFASSMLLLLLACSALASVIRDGPTIAEGGRYFVVTPSTPSQHVHINASVGLLSPTAIRVSVEFLDEEYNPLTAKEVGIAQFEAVVTSTTGDPPDVIMSNIMLLSSDRVTYFANFELPPLGMSMDYEVAVFHSSQLMPCRKETLLETLGRCVVVDCIFNCPWDAEVVKDPKDSIIDHFKMGSMFSVAITNYHVHKPADSGPALLSRPDAPSANLAHVLRNHFTHINLTQPLVATSSPAASTSSASVPGKGVGGYWSDSQPYCKSGRSRGAGSGVWMSRQFVCHYDKQMCDEYATVGAHLDAPYIWMPTGCRMRVYQPSQAVACMGKLPKTWFFGDSLSRNTYLYLKDFLGKEDSPGKYVAAKVKSHYNSQYNTSGVVIGMHFNSGSILLDFQRYYKFAVFFASKDEHASERVMFYQPSRWDIYLPMHLYKTAIRNTLQELCHSFAARIIFVLPEPTQRLTLRLDLPLRMAALSVLADESFRTCVTGVVDPFTMEVPFRYQANDGLHFDGHLVRVKVNTLLNELCEPPA